MSGRAEELQCHKGNSDALIPTVAWSAGSNRPLAAPARYMRAPLERLPVELLDIITTDIDLAVFQAIRISSRHLYLLTLPAFTRRYFAKVTTTLGSPSLHRLLNISTRAYLAKSVTLLKITLLNDYDYEVLQDITRVGIFPPPRRFPRVYRVKPQHIGEESKLFNEILQNEDPKHVVNSLALALEGFPNLTGIRFHIHQVRPKRAGLPMPLKGQLFHTRCFNAVLNAIVKSGIRLTEFRMANGQNLASLVKGAFLPYSALQRTASVTTALKHCFSTLETLSLSVLTSQHGGKWTPERYGQVAEFISTCPSVRRLYLSLDFPFPHLPFSTDVVRSLSQSVRLNQLEIFHLYHCSCDEHDLALLIEAHSQTLRRLTLSHIRLRRGKWSSLLKMFLRVTNLDYLRLTVLWRWHSLVDFSGNEENKQDEILDIDKDQRSMEDMLSSLIEIFIVDDENYGEINDEDLDT